MRAAARPRAGARLWPAARTTPAVLGSPSPSARPGWNGHELETAPTRHCPQGVPGAAVRLPTAASTLLVGRFPAAAKRREQVRVQPHAIVFLVAHDSAEQW